MRRLLTFLAVLVVQSASGVAQTPPRPLRPVPPIPVGARVRLWTPERWIVGTATAVGQDAIDIREDRTGQVWDIPFASARLEISQGVETARYGAAAGALGGFILGEVIGLVLVRPAGGGSTDPGTRTFERLRSGPVLLIGAAGAVAGFFAGRRIRGERWEPVSFRPEVGVAPTGRGVALALTWRR